MKEASLWNPQIYYFLWYLLVVMAVGIAANIIFWERVVDGFKFILASFVKYIAFLFALYNIGLVICSSNDWITNYSLWAHRSFSVAAIPVALFVVMTYINIRSYGAPPEGRARIGEGYRMIESEIQEMSQKVAGERRRTARLARESAQIIHNSQG